jgi:hypothetical protein
MNRFIKMLAGTCVAALALTAMATTSASAAAFTWSETGSLTGTGTTNHVFTPGSFGSITCKNVHTTGTIISTAAASLHVTVKYGGCTAFSGNYAATVSEATYELHADGTVDVENEIKVSVPGAFCTNTVKPQIGKGTVSYTNKSGKIEKHSAITGIISSGSGFCAGGSNGTTSGSALLERVGGGTLSWHA